MTFLSTCVHMVRLAIAIVFLSFIEPCVAASALVEQVRAGGPSTVRNTRDSITNVLKVSYGVTDAQFVDGCSNMEFELGRWVRGWASGNDDPVQAEGFVAYRCPEKSSLGSLFGGTKAVSVRSGMHLLAVARHETHAARALEGERSVAVELGLVNEIRAISNRPF